MIQWHFGNNTSKNKVRINSIRGTYTILLYYIPRINEKKTDNYFFITIDATLE